VTNYAIGNFELNHIDEGGYDPKTIMPIPRPIRELVFKSSIIAAENEIGIRFGVHVNQNYRELMEIKKELIPFELLDNPMVHEADWLFSSDMTAYEIEHGIGDPGEPLTSRMSRVNKFVMGMLQYPRLKKIYLYLIADDEEKEAALQIQASEFYSTILGLFNKHGGRPPSVKLAITK
jgi:hypothetical protein